MKSSPSLRMLYFQSGVKLCLALHIIRPHGAVCHLNQSWEMKEKEVSASYKGFFFFFF